MNFIKTSLALAAALLAAASALGQTPPAAASAASAPRTVLGSGIDLSAIDPAVRAQDDLYDHVNGTWMAHTTFPPDKARIGVFDKLFDTTQDQLLALIQGAPSLTGDPDAAKIADLYASFMDEAAIEKLGRQPILAEVATIDAVSGRKQFVALMPHLTRLGVAMPIGIRVGQDNRDATRYVPSLYQSGLGLPNRDYYLKTDDAKFASVRDKYVQYLARILALGGDKAPTEPTARAVLALETEIARAQWSAVENRDPIKGYNRVDVGDLPALAPGVDWSAFLAAAQLSGRTPDVVVRQPTYLKGLAALLDSTPLSTWKAYARARLLGAYAPFLSKDFVDTRFEFAGTVLTGAEVNRDRWKRGVRLVDQSIGEGMGRLYVAKYFPPENKRRMDELVGNLMAAYRESIGTIDWMGPATRKEALAKLARFNAKIAYPNRWIDYSALQIRRDDLVGNVMRANEFDYTREIDKLGKPIDREEWGMTPQTINAYYSPTMNEVVFPAAFLQAPMFDPKADDAVNYGAVGAVIGHEISHGFDDQGSQYDGTGNLRDWWTAEDRKNFSAKTQALVAQYSAFVAVPPDYHVNGELTLGENIADNSGLAIAWKAYQRSLGGKPAPVIDGMTGDQRFFFGYAQAWRGKDRPDALLAQIKSDPHSPGDFRVLGAVRNQPGFYSTFAVKPGDKMYLAPKDRVSIW